MKVVTISLDPKMLDSESVPALRARRYGTIVDLYSVIVPTPALVTTRLSDSVMVYGVGGRLKIVRLWNVYKQILKLVREGKCDVLSSSDIYFIGCIALCVARTYHLGFELQVLGIEKLSPFRRIFFSYVLKHTQVIRALSERIKERIITEFGIERERIHVVTIYVDVSTLGLSERSLPEQERVACEKLVGAFKEQYGNRMNFLTVSRLVPIKRIENILHAVRKISREDASVLLHIVGDGPERKSLEKVVVNFGIEQHVIFHGYQSGYALGVLYSECDCFVLASEYEGWSMVVIEAATSGLPVIMTDVGCAGEFIIAEESGIIIPVSDIRALTVAMERIMHEPKLRTKLSEGVIRQLATLPRFDAILEEYKRNWKRTLQHIQ